MIVEPRRIDGHVYETTWPLRAIVRSSPWGWVWVELRWFAAESSAIGM